MGIDPNKHVPIYEQIIDHICGSIAAELFAVDGPLPSIRALALELVVNPNTVQRAYQELERLGLVRTRKGLGIFVTDDAVDLARRRSEESVRTMFSAGIDLGRQADLPQETMKSIFHQVLATRAG